MEFSAIKTNKLLIDRYGNTGEAQKHYVPRNRPGRRLDTRHGSLHVRFWNRRNHSVVIEIRTVVVPGVRWGWEGTQNKISGVMAMFCVSFGVVDT